MLEDINIKYWELAHSRESLGYHKTNDYSARCDVCGDSSKNKNAKRLQLYRKNSYDNDSIKCFNCDYSGSMWNYLKEHHPSLFNSYKQELMSDKLFNLQHKPSVLVEQVQIVPKVNTLQTFSKPPELISIRDSIEGLEYLTKRGFPLVEAYYANGHISGLEKDITLNRYIVIPLKENDKWYGFYSRNIDKKIFYTYIPESNSGYKVWNWFNISKLDTVYIFEAIFNALSSGLNNVIAVLGSDLDEARLKELKNPVFCFDNDTTGREKAKKYAGKGHQVCVLPKEYTDDYNDMLKKGVKPNDIAKLIKSNVVSGLKAQIMLKVG